MSDARLRGHVIERAAAAVPVESMLRAGRDCGIANRSSVHEKQVDPTVVVEIEEQASAAHDLRQMALGARAVGVTKTNARRGGYFVETWRGGLCAESAAVQLLAESAATDRRISRPPRMAVSGPIRATASPFADGGTSSAPADCRLSVPVKHMQPPGAYEPRTTPAAAPLPLKWSTASAGWPDLRSATPSSRCDEAASGARSSALRSNATARSYSPLSDRSEASRLSPFSVNWRA